MNNPVSSPAAASRAGKTHVLDLTSVCVSSGTVRLPLSLQGHFTEGEVIAHTADGELELQFQAPRTLGGLTEFFAANDLRANDRVGFEFSDGQLNLTAIRRERRSSSASASARAQQSAASTTAPRVEGREAQRGGAGGATDTANQENLKPAGEVSDAPVLAGEGEAQRGSVRAVKRVRIEGGTPPRHDLPAPQPIDRASSRDVWARRQYPAWRPLDRTDGDAPAANEEYDGAFSETTVRVIRRSDRNAGTNAQPSSPEQHPKAGPTGAQTKSDEAPSYAPEWPLVSRGRLKDTPRQAAPTAELDPYLDARVDVDREAEQARYAAAGSPPAGRDDTHYSRDRGSNEEAAISGYAADGQRLEGQQWPERGGWQEEAVEVAASARSAQAQPYPQRERRGGLLSRLGLKRSTGPRQDEANQGAGFGSDDSFEARPVEADPARPRIYTDQSVWPLNAGDSGSEDDIAGSLLSEPDLFAAAPVEPGPSAQASGTAAVEATSPTPLPTAEAVTKAPAATTGHQTAAQAAGGHLGDTLKADIELLEQHLAQPETAAIVRCEELAKRLGIEYQRVSRAFQRMAEDRDRYTPLRGDAYMVRRNR